MKRRELTQTKVKNNRLQIMIFWKKKKEYFYKIKLILIFEFLFFKLRMKLKRLVIVFIDISPVVHENMCLYRKIIPRELYIHYFLVKKLLYLLLCYRDIVNINNILVICNCSFEGNKLETHS